MPRSRRVAVEVYFAADVEADGPIPGPYSMLSLGLSVVGRPDLTFYTELSPISDDFVEAAMAVNGLDRDRLVREAPEPQAAMRAAAEFIEATTARVGDEAGQRARPVFLAGPAVWDGMWIHWYFIRFLGRNPFGVTGSGIDFRSYWMGLDHTRWSKTGKKAVAAKLGEVDLPHTHRADDDAKELAAYFEKVLAHTEAARRALRDKEEAIADLERRIEAEGRRHAKAEKKLKKSADRPAVEVAVAAWRGGRVLARAQPSRLPGGRLRRGELARDAARRTYEAAAGAPPAALSEGPLVEVATEDRSAWVRLFFAEGPEAAPEGLRFVSPADLEDSDAPVRAALEAEG